MAINVFVFVGESNSGGVAPNTEIVTPSELGSQPQMTIYNNLTGALEPLNINKASDGGNNLLGHAGLDSSRGSHGWELGIAKAVKADLFGDDKIYLLKTGQGGSNVSQWQTGSGYQQTFTQRSIAFQQLVPNARPIICATVGINDSLLTPPTTSTDYKAGLIAAIALWRQSWPSALLLLSEVTPFYTARNQDIRDVAALTSNCYLIDSSSVPVTDDVNHWYSEGMKAIASKIVSKTLQIYPAYRSEKIKGVLSLPTTIYINGKEDRS